MPVTPSVFCNVRVFLSLFSTKRKKIVQGKVRKKKKKKKVPGRSIGSDVAQYKTHNLF